MIVICIALSIIFWLAAAVVFSLLSIGTELANLGALLITGDFRRRYMLAGEKQKTDVSLKDMLICNMIKNNERQVRQQAFAEMVATPATVTVPRRREHNVMPLPIVVEDWPVRKVEVEA